MRIHSFENHSI